MGMDGEYTVGIGTSICRYGDRFEVCGNRWDWIENPVRSESSDIIFMSLVVSVSIFLLQSYHITIVTDA
jgi:hypothetical protein